MQTQSTNIQHKCTELENLFTVLLLAASDAAKYSSDLEYQLLKAANTIAHELNDPDLLAEFWGDNRFPDNYFPIPQYQLQLQDVNFYQE